jgi:single-strand DNA-binding protein
MSNLNRVFLMGNLTRDPEIRPTANSVVCLFSMALNRGRADAEGKRPEATTFVDIEAWGRMGEVLKQYLKKGDPLLIEGRIKQDRWEDPQGGKRSKLKVVAESFQFVSGSHSPRRTEDVPVSENRHSPGDSGDRPQAASDRSHRRQVAEVA